MAKNTQYTLFKTRSVLDLCPAILPDSADGSHPSRLYPLLQVICRGCLLSWLLNGFGLVVDKLGR